MLVPDALYQFAVEAIDAEMKSSKELTKWPCGSFRPLETGDLMLPVASTALAANCSGRFVTCSVRFDLQGG